MHLSMVSLLDLKTAILPFARIYKQLTSQYYLSVLLYVHVHMHVDEVHVVIVQCTILTS